MGFNLNAGMQALANFGTGYYQGQDTARQQQYQQQMNNLALQNNQLILQQNQQKAAQQQAMSDYMMQQFSAQNMKQPTVPPPPPGQTGQPQSPVDPTQGLLSNLQQGINQNLNFAHHAMATGNMDGYQQIMTNVANMTDTMAQVRQRQAGTQESQGKADLTYAEEMGRYAGAVPDSPEGLQQLKAIGMAQFPQNSPAMQTLNKMQWRPGLMQQLQNAALTSAQRIRLQQQQSKLDADRANIANQIANRNANTVIRDRLAKWKEDHPAGVGQSGQLTKSATQAQINQLVPVVARTLYGDKWRDNVQDANNPIFAGPKSHYDDKTGKTTTDFNTEAMQHIANIALAKMRQTPGLTLEEAGRKAAEEARKTGSVVVTPEQTRDTTFLGIHTGSEVVHPASSKYVSDADKDVIPFTGQPASELVKGKKYSYGGETRLWVGNGWQKLPQ